jgi:hypothetical protein
MADTTICRHLAKLSNDASSNVLGNHQVSASQDHRFHISKDLEARYTKIIRWASRAEGVKRRKVGLFKITKHRTDSYRPQHRNAKHARAPSPDHGHVSTARISVVYLLVVPHQPQKTACEAIGLAHPRVPLASGPLHTTGL